MGSPPTCSSGVIRAVAAEAELVPTELVAATLQVQATTVCEFPVLPAGLSVVYRTIIELHTHTCVGNISYPIGSCPPMAVSFGRGFHMT